MYDYVQGTETSGIEDRIELLPKVVKRRETLLFDKNSLLTSLHLPSSVPLVFILSRPIVLSLIFPRETVTEASCVAEEGGYTILPIQSEMFINSHRTSREYGRPSLKSC